MTPRRDGRMDVVMVAFPKMTQLDLTGPFEAFTRFPELAVHVVAKTTDVVVDASGLRIAPSIDFSRAPQATILMVPGGPGVADVMGDAETLAFVRAQAAGADYVTSVCTGSLVLGAAGLLDGYRATCHWMSLPMLAHFGATPVAQRVVVDRNRVTGAGVTSGIDFALTLTARLFGEERARSAAIAMEYDPQPPFPGTGPATADPATLERLRAAAAPRLAGYERAIRDAAARLR